MLKAFVEGGSKHEYNEIAMSNCTISSSNRSNRELTKIWIIAKVDISGKIVKITKKDFCQKDVQSGINKQKIEKKKNPKSIEDIYLKIYRTFTFIIELVPCVISIF